MSMSAPSINCKLHEVSSHKGNCSSQSGPDLHSTLLRAAGLTILLFSSLMAFVASSGVDSCTKPTPLLAPVFWSRSTLQEMMVPNSCSTHQ